MLRRFVLLGVLAVPAAAAAVAEEGEAPDEVIVITATRSAQAATDQAGNTARLDEAEIDAIHADHIAEALNRLPGVYLHRGNGAEHLTAIRSPVLTGGAGAGSFLYLENGVPLRAAGFANVNGLFEAHGEIAGAIEVTRGPGSSLYGSNAVHGLINVIPRVGEGTGGRVEVLGGSFGRARVNGWVSEERNAHQFMLGGTFLHENGFRDDAGLDQTKLTTRHLWEGETWRGDTVVSFTQLEQETAGFVQGPNAYDDSALARTNANPEAFRDAYAFRLSSRWERRLAHGARLSLTPFARTNEMDFLMHFLPSKALEESGHSSIGLLSALYLDVNGGEVILGADGEWTRGHLRETQSRPSFGSFPQGVHYDYEVDAGVIAGYLHSEWPVTERIRVVAGARLEHTTYDYDNRAASDTVGRFQRPPDRRDTFTTFNPRFGVVADLDERWTGFANYARGSRAPQTADLYRLQINQDVGEIDPETIDSFEVGVRRAGSGSWLEVTGYWMEKENFFFRDTDGFNVPDGRTRHLGIEAEVAWPLTSWLTLAASGTYARHTYRFTNEVAVNSTESIFTGDDVDSAPRTLANLRLIWTPRDDLRGEVEWVHVGRYFTDAANLHRYPGHDLINLRLSWQASEDWGVFVALRNATGTDYAERADYSFGSERYFPGEPRALELGISRRF
jgi:outer membrane receptor protein involved in Fe transport